MGHKGPTSRDEAPIEGVGLPFFSKDVSMTPNILPFSN